MNNNNFEIYAVGSSYYRMFILKAKFAFKLDNVDEIVSFPSNRINTPFLIQSSNVSNIPRFMKDSVAEVAICRNANFKLPDDPDEARRFMDRCFSHYNKRDRYIFSLDFPNTMKWDVNRKIYNEFRKNRNPQVLLDAINKYGLSLGNIRISGPKKIINMEDSKKYIKLDIKESLVDILKRGRDDKFNLKFAEYITSSGLSRFLEYE